MKAKLVSAPTSDTRLVFVTTREASAIADFEGHKRSTTVRYENDSTIIYCGIGDEDSLSAAAFRQAAATGIRAAAEIKRKTVTLLEHPRAAKNSDFARASLEGALLGGYRFSKYKTTPPDRVRKVEYAGDGIERKQVAKIVGLCEAVAYARDLTNENASVMYPAQLAREAQKVANAGKMEITLLTDKDIRRKGLGLLSAVGQGAPFPPRLALIEYTGNPRSKQRIAVVGKGVTFDSGGLNLKSTGHIETMREDMGGAAAVLGLMKALSVVKPKVNVIGVIAAAYNAIDGTSYFPGDIYRSYSGKTVEITSTDAEGRLIMADAFSYVQENFGATQLLDLATLTGGVLSALGDTMAAVIANDTALSQALIAAGERTGERLWPLPLEEEHTELMKSNLADLRNTSKGKKGHASTITAGAFLQEFVEKIPWAHLDIAGTAFNQGEARGEIPRYGTGFGVRLLVDYLLNITP
jgi:leucyl aminopeptidase